MTFDDYLNIGNSNRKHYAYTFGSRLCTLAGLLMIGGDDHPMNVCTREAEDRLWIKAFGKDSE